tara:strand:+ start:204 stop:518 length:315 start_codon:yes stop_codon:yes gene_type:complete
MMIDIYEIQMLIINSNAWLIFGLVLVVVEVLFIGSMVFILPIGLAAILNGIILFLMTMNTAIDLTLNDWYVPMISLSIFSFIFLFLIQKLIKRNKSKNVDINDY